MSRCFIEGRGSGGTSKLFAAIGVAYPAGTELSCSNGTKTLKAKKGTGRWIFPIPEAGDWTVTLTDGSITKEQTVNITYEGQVESLTMEFWDGTIYDSGDEYSAYTGGWVTGGYDASKADNKLYVSVYQTSQKSWVRTADKISLAGVSEIRAVITAQTHKSSWGGNERCKLVVSANEDLSSPLASIQPTTDAAQTLGLQLETASLPDTYYVGLLAAAGTASNASMTCEKIQLI